MAEEYFTLVRCECGHSIWKVRQPITELPDWARCKRCNERASVHRGNEAKLRGILEEWKAYEMCPSCANDLQVVEVGAGYVLMGCVRCTRVTWLPYSLAPVGLL
jgi:hypothetical protein